jgi:hypothetical protein
VRLKFCENLACLKALIGGKFNDDLLFQFHREDCQTYFHRLLPIPSGLPRHVNRIAICKQGARRLVSPGILSPENGTKIILRAVWGVDFKSPTPSFLAQPDSPMSSPPFDGIPRNDSGMLREFEWIPLCPGSTRLLASPIFIPSI